MADSIALNRASRTRSEVGRVPFAGTVSRRPPAAPATILVTGASSQARVPSRVAAGVWSRSTELAPVDPRGGHFTYAVSSCSLNQPLGSVRGADLCQGDRDRGRAGARGRGVRAG